MITLDTSALLAILNARDRYHTRITTALRAESGAYIVPAGMLSELAYMIETRYGLRALDIFLSDCERGASIIDCGGNDIPRIRALIRRYADLPLGFADTAVIACAERHGGRVLTTRSPALQHRRTRRHTHDIAGIIGIVRRRNEIRRRSRYAYRLAARNDHRNDPPLSRRAVPGWATEGAG